MPRPPYWTQIPCLPYVPDSNAYTASCAVTEGDEHSTGHSHWANPDGVEVITSHPEGQITAPNCIIRKPGT